MTTPLTTRIPIKDAQGNVIAEKEVATYAGLLARAHEEGLSEIETVILQSPAEMNGGTAVCAARVTTKRGTYCGVGDASAGNVNRRIVPHIIRMAETRAKARALRDAVNIGVVALEELGDEAGEVPGGEGTPSTPPPPAVPPDPGGTGPQGNSGNGRTNGRSGGARLSGNGNGHGGNGRSGSFVRMTDPQRKLVYRLIAEAGFEGNGIEQEICRRANVASIAAVSRGKASQIIEIMKGQQRGVGHA